MADHLGHSVLLVPVPQLERYVRARTEHYDPAYVSADPAFVHAHVTVLGPFLAPDEIDHNAVRLIDQITSATAPFVFTLSRLATFPNGIVHLLPEPAGPFRRLTAALWDAFPTCPPYAGAFPEVVPHLTLDALSADVTAESAREAVSPWTPARCRAERVDLAWYEPGGCRVVRSWRLGSTPSDATPE